MTERPDYAIDLRWTRAKLAMQDLCTAIDALADQMALVPRHVDDADYALLPQHYREALDIVNGETDDA